MFVPGITVLHIQLFLPTNLPTRNPEDGITGRCLSSKNGIICKNVQNSWNKERNRCASVCPSFRQYTITQLRIGIF